MSTRFPGVRLQPLGHLSVQKIYQVLLQALHLGVTIFLKRLLRRFAPRNDTEPNYEFAKLPYN